MIVAYVQGESTEAIAKRMGCNPETLRQRLIKLGVTKRQITTEQKEQIINLYQQGLSSLMVAKKLGINHGTVEYHIAKSGVSRSFSEAQFIRRRQR